MAYDEDLADRIRVAMQHVESVTEKKMFGGHAFLVRGNMAAAASGQGGVLLRCDPAQTEELVAAPGVERFAMRGREMDGWLHLAAEAVTTESDLQRWVDVGVAYARSLPAK